MRNPEPIVINGFSREAKNYVEHLKPSMHVNADVATPEECSLLDGVTQSITNRTRLTST